MAEIGLLLLAFVAGFHTHRVIAAARRRRLNAVRAPRVGMVYLRPRTRPMAVRKENRA